MAKLSDNVIELVKASVNKITSFKSAHVVEGTNKKTNKDYYYLRLSDFGGYVGEEILRVKKDGKTYRIKLKFSVLAHEVADGDTTASSNGNDVL